MSDIEKIKETMNELEKVIDKLQEVSKQNDDRFLEIAALKKENKELKVLADEQSINVAYQKGFSDGQEKIFTLRDLYNRAVDEIREASINNIDLRQENDKLKEIIKVMSKTPPIEIIKKDN